MGAMKFMLFGRRQKKSVENYNENLLRFYLLASIYIAKVEFD